MHISADNFHQFIPEPGLDRLWALAMVQRHYCSVLSLRGTCPQKCSHCRDLLAGIFDIGSARSPSAVLVWRLDNLAAGKISIWTSPRKHQEEHLDSAGLPQTDHPFDALASAFSLTK